MTNAMLNTSLMGAMSGSSRKVAGPDTNAIVMPAIKIVPAGTATVNLNTVIGDVTVSTYEVGTAKVVGMANNGAITKTFALGTEASSTEYSVNNSTNVLTLPTNSGEDQFVITYNRSVISGYAVENRSDRYPQTIRLLLKVLYVDPCTAD